MLNHKDIVIDWVGGNCPVQAEGMFDNIPFYFRARGSTIYVEVGNRDSESARNQHWMWHGPKYDWPEAGYISEVQVLQYIDMAYLEWKQND